MGGNTMNSNQQEIPDDIIHRPESKITIRQLVSAMKERVAGFTIFFNALPDGNHVVEMGTYSTSEMCSVPVMIRFFGSYLVDYYTCIRGDDDENVCLVCLEAGDFSPAMPVRAFGC